MRITNCVPLAGQGVIARYGGLVAVTDGRGPGPDPLLSVVAETAGEADDGSGLVIRAARAALTSHRQAAWACAGVTADGGMAVLVHGHAAATVSVDDGPEVTLTVGDSKLPVSRTFTGVTVTVILVIGGAAPPDERFWLGDGVVPGGGLAMTASAVTAPARVRPPARHRADSPRPEVARANGPRPEVSRADSPRPDVLRADGPQPEVSRADSPRPDVLRADGPRPDVSRANSPRPDVLRADAPRPDVSRPVPVAQPSGLDLAAAGPVSDPEVAPRDGQGGNDPKPDAQGADDPEQPLEQGGWHAPTMDAPAVGTPAGTPPAVAASEDAVLVDGVLCANRHFNDPGAWCCRQCGVGLEQPPRHFDRRPRPPLGELVLDDGTRVTLDGDYVLGREPTLDGDVLAGRAQPVRINDPKGTVSRLHLKVSLVGWQVEVSDLGSANGSFIQAPGEERTLTPFEPTAIEPGARIGLGHRSMQYVAYQGARDHE